jgi:phosphate-selective porin OprO/OprP
MKLKLLVPVILSILIVNPSYSVSEQEFNEMKELLQNALIKINALEQAQKQNLSNSKSNVITKADKLSINTSGGGIKIKSGDQKFAIGGRLMMDYDNMDSGHQTENKSFSDMEWRRTRINIKGSINKHWSYKATYDFNSEKDSANLDEGYIKYDSKKGFYITAGKTKADMMLEQRTSSKWISTIERGLLNEFNEKLTYLVGKPGDGAGVKLGFYDKDSRMFGSLSVFDAYKNDSSDNDWILHTTAIVGISPKLGKNNYAHFAASYGSADYEGNSISPSLRLGVHQGDKVTPFNTSAAGDITIYGLEGAYVDGPLSFQAEYIDTEVEHNTTGATEYEWDGYYGQISYIFTGETRSYKWKSGKFDKVKPKGGMGALEAVLRYEDVSVTDSNTGTVNANDIDIDRMVLGLNWYINKSTKFMVNYVSVGLDNLNNPAGNTSDKDSIQTRLQYAF